MTSHWASTRHLTDDVLAEIWTTAVAEGRTASHPHFDACSECRYRYADFTRFLDEIKDDAHAEADQADVGGTARSAAGANRPPARGARTARPGHRVPEGRRGRRIRRAALASDGLRRPRLPDWSLAWRLVSSSISAARSRRPIARLARSSRTAHPCKVGQRDAREHHRSDRRGVHLRRHGIVRPQACATAPCAAFDDFTPRARDFDR